jgi:hypothetical protein
MDTIHAHLKSLRVPGLQHDVCYAQHLQHNLDSARNDCVSGIRAIVRGFLPFMYPEFDPTHTGCVASNIASDAEPISEQPRPTKKDE